MESNTTIQENAYNLGIPYAYDTAMEALSSLITSKRRGDGSTRSAKYDKLERMLMYIKILGLEEHIAGLKIIHVAGTKGKPQVPAFTVPQLSEAMDVLQKKAMELKVLVTGSLHLVGDVLKLLRRNSWFLEMKRRIKLWDRIKNENAGQDLEK
ncbi:UNVERIFIED_CONTAM: Folylpolyglutamate synthase [Sesamum latifolium]|uniref:Folylpolyglutamate synthase n=1 Tax=Sesamum latifolium TaxID=2727402 RepID=A0AAW2XGS9_9LAMI